MARTYKKEPFKLYHKEKKADRHEDYKKYRKKTKQLLRYDYEEELPNYTRTSGYLSW